MTKTEIRLAQKEWLRKIYGPTVNGKRISWLTKPEIDAAIAAAAQGLPAPPPPRKLRPVASPAQDMSGVLDMPDHWLTEIRPTPEIRTVGDLLDLISTEEMVDWPDAKVSQDARYEAIGRLVDSRLLDVHDLLSERYDDDPARRARVDRLFEALVVLNAWKPADRAKPMVPWPAKSMAG